VKYYSDKYVQCPFYKNEQGVQIHCEGFSENNRLHLWFESKEALTAHKKQYCKNGNSHRKCPLYGAINKQYEESGDEEQIWQ
jgi:hypothetical protein